MAFLEGTRIGPYEIVGKIGAGGMGEVYKARDPKLGRLVAIKVLPTDFAQDPERLRRFETEARSVSALNHPNILTVHDLGTHDGSPFLVMELLEGETLRERMAGKPLPARKAAEIGLQVARGLAAAHGKGIIHRDLKPENLFITLEGHVKILDFGLARMRSAESLGGSSENGSTVALGTRPGMVMGTVGYMAPEQVRGEEAGPAADIFSMGCVLFEMLAGRRAFQGDSAVAVLNEILTQDPMGEGSGLGGVPLGLGKIVERCLEKLPGDRFHSAHDLAFALEAASMPGSGSAGQLPRRGREPRKLLLAIGAIFLIAAISGTGWWLGRRSAPNPMPTFKSVTFRRGTVLAARFTPDGQSVIYTAGWEGEAPRMFHKLLDSEDAVPLGPPGAIILSISRKRELAVLLESHLTGPLSRTGTLATMSIAGDSPKPIENDISAADWSPVTGELAMVRDLNDHQRLEFPRGKPLYETTGWLSSLRFSPDGTEIAFLEHPLREDESGYPVRLQLAASKARWPDAKARSALFYGIAWSPDGNEVFSAQGKRVTAIDRGGKQRIVAKLPRGAAIHDLYSDGRILLGEYSMGVGMACVDEKGQRDLSWLSWSLVMDMMPDGTKAVFTEFGTAKEPCVSALRGLDGSPVVRLGEGMATGISPDGSLVAAINLATQQIVLLPTGVGEARILPSHGILSSAHARFLPDGKNIVFYGHKAGQAPCIFVQGIDGGEPRALGGKGAGFGMLAVSPAGDRVVATGPDRRPWIFPLTGEATPFPGGVKGDLAICWGADGKAVFFHSHGTIPVPIRKVDAFTGRSEVVRTLSPSDPTGVQWVGPVAMTADAKRYVFSYHRVISDLYLVEGME
ncbi:MAG: protein kinase [Holophagaceae bacterium]|nr:protein kinase [Holophagaceae bacterium]